MYMLYWLIPCVMCNLLKEGSDVLAVKKGGEEDSLYFWKIQPNPSSLFPQMGVHLPRLHQPQKDSRRGSSHPACQGRRQPNLQGNRRRSLDHGTQLQDREQALPARDEQRDLRSRASAGPDQEWWRKPREGRVRLTWSGHAAFSGAHTQVEVKEWEARSWAEQGGRTRGRGREEEGKEGAIGEERVAEESGIGERLVCWGEEVKFEEGQIVWALG